MGICTIKIEVLVLNIGVKSSIGGSTNVSLEMELREISIII